MSRRGYGYLHIEPPWAENTDGTHISPSLISSLPALVRIASPLSTSRFQVGQPHRRLFQPLRLRVQALRRRGGQRLAREQATSATTRSDVIARLNANQARVGNRASTSQPLLAAME